MEVQPSNSPFSGYVRNKSVYSHQCYLRDGLLGLNVSISQNSSLDVLMLVSHFVTCVSADHGQSCHAISVTISGLASDTAKTSIITNADGGIEDELTVIRLVRHDAERGGR